LRQAGRLDVLRLRLDVQEPGSMKYEPGTKKAYRGTLYHFATLRSRMTEPFSLSLQIVITAVSQLPPYKLMLQGKRLFETQ
jgi:hypothetical protein